MELLLLLLTDIFGFSSTSLLFDDGTLISSFESTSLKLSEPSLPITLVAGEFEPFDFVSTTSWTAADAVMSEVLPNFLEAKPPSDLCLNLLTYDPSAYTAN